MPPADPINSSIAVTAPDIALGSTLCTACGLCCNGALHGFAVLDDDEIETAGLIGHKLRADGRPGFALPCPFLQNSSCTIYADRPKVCARYKCGLLDRFEAGEVTLAAAITIVGGAKKLVDRVRAVMPEGMTIPAARALCDAPPTTAGDAGERASGMRLRLVITALNLFLDKNFKNAREGKFLSLETVEARPDMEMK